MRIAGRLAWLACGAAWAVAAAPASVAEARSPNVVLILVDDLGYGDLGCYGAKLARTPHCDRLAKEGVRFTQFYVASPICSASRVALTTGMYPARWKITSYLQTRAGNRFCEQADFLDPRAPSLARTLKAAGYATAHFGKWHMGGGRDVTDAPKPSQYGFDEWGTTWESPDPHSALGLRLPPWDARTEPGQVERWERTAWMVDRTLDFVRKNQDRPWYVNLWPDDVHTPHVPGPASKDAKPEENFRRVLEEFDRQIGRLLDGLKEAGAERNTIVIFAGDNGPEPSFDHVRTAGLRGMKWSLYEGGIRVPFILRWPDHIPAGLVNETTVHSAVDLFPTLCRLCGAQRPHGATWDGDDLASAWLGKAAVRSRPLFWEYGRKPGEAGKIQGFPYSRPARDRSPNVAVREGNWKLLVNADGSGAELYDLAADPNETSNLAGQRPDVAKRLVDQALNWRKSLP